MIAKLSVLLSALAAAAGSPVFTHIYAPNIGHTIVPGLPRIAPAGAPLPHSVAAPVIGAQPVDPNPAYNGVHNGVVQGSFSLLGHDGHERHVTYTADNVNGFNAVVERDGAAAHAAPFASAHAPIGVASGPVTRLTLPGIAHPLG